MRLGSHTNPPVLNEIQEFVFQQNVLKQKLGNATQLLKREGSFGNMNLFADDLKYYFDTHF